MIRVRQQNDDGVVGDREVAFDEHLPSVGHAENHVVFKFLLFSKFIALGRHVKSNALLSIQGGGGNGFIFEVPITLTKLTVPSQRRMLARHNPWTILFET
jgi:hypothetical protein